MIKLTIAIPTYNRAALLEQRLAELMPQLREQVEIFVCNDGSSDDTAEICARYARPGLRVHLNNPNLGLSGSMLTLFQRARGQWLWTLGDDDAPLPNAVDLVLEMIGKYPETGVITFRNPTITVERDTVYLSLDDFLRDRLVLDVSFLSANVYNLSKIRPHFKVFVQATITTAPHSVVILRMIETQSAPLRFLVTDLLRETDANRRWSSLDVAIGWSMIPEFIKSPALQKRGALGAWYQTRWLQKYGLREVHDASSWQQWKRKTRTADALLRGYGAHLWSMLFARPFNAREYRVGLEMKIISWMPYFLICKAATSMRARRGGDSVIMENT